MVWFGKRKEQAELEAEPELKPASIPAALRFQRGLADFKTSVLALDFAYTSKKDAQARGAFIATIDRVAKLAEGVDLEGARSELVFQELGWLTNARPYGSAPLRSLQDDELTSTFNLALETSQVLFALGRIHANLRRLAPTPHQQAVAADAATLLFPDYKHLSGSQQQSLAELEGDWRKRAEQELDVEDRYYVETLVNSYLPESITLLTSLREDAKLGHKAAEMFEQQVTLLHKRLLEIEDRTAANKLTEMAVHSAFLKERLRRDDKSDALQLDH